ncbi:hypothetical protein PPTG_15279 [Phytophthora nicotianae INRA-310]|uniref:Uncharacterized protein n=2 Tax=Phytophthora nicotianae TaxID=4792 RepID=W2PTZ4_PHYN3|nr:hypothetical protein PPTG_15279 [Phytophthora nicotianae INRA-310]ETN04101.1 hypothetical protein PPTG_15279 [Phytophthora nicotianae INRA-310]
MRRHIVNRTNNPLERFHRELNKSLRPHPTMKQFVTTLEIQAREYVVQRNVVIAGVAVPPSRSGFVLPKATRLPNVTNIDASTSSLESDSHVVNEEADSERYSTDMSPTSEEIDGKEAIYEQDISFE